MIVTLFRKDRVRSQAETLFAALAAQARAPEFYRSAGAPDTPEGRFDMLALHMFLAIHRLRRDAPEHGQLIRRLQEVFFEHLDSALREMGVGDLSGGRKIRGLAEAFYGRLSAYEGAIAADDGSLALALARNVLGSDKPQSAAPLAAYAMAARGALMGKPAAALDAAFRDLGGETAALLGEAPR